MLNYANLPNIKFTHDYHVYYGNYDLLTQFSNILMWCLTNLIDIYLNMKPNLGRTQPKNGVDYALIYGANTCFAA